MGNLMDNFRSKEELKFYSNEKLRALCRDIRRKLVYTVSHTGGHLASNLGVVELTVALHTVFDTPKDQIIFDVGHQTYTHKLLTGRKDRFNSLRQEGGISGFSRPSESKHDSFISGHSSMSVSAALGAAYAKKLKGEKGKVIALMGDGALSGGIAYEGLNNCSTELDNLIVILNDNEMSIGKNVGAMANYLTQIRSSSGYYKAKDVVQRVVKKTPLIGNGLYKAISKSKAALKNIIYQVTFFEDMGFHYLGPIDGHDMDQLLVSLNRAKEAKEPVFLHVITQKGKGYNFAEENPGAFHGVSQFNVETGNPDEVKSDSFSEVFGKKLAILGKKDKKICAVTAAMKYPTGLNHFKKMDKKRFFDVGIAEQHATTFSAGLAKNGMKPVFAVYSTFLQRAYDQLIHDVSILNLPVFLAIDRAGIVGDDGETHQGIFDVSMLLSISNFSIYAPSNYSELEYWMTEILENNDGPTALRYPRGGQDPRLSTWRVTGEETDFLEGQNKEILVITYGRLFADVLEAREELNCDILKLNRLAPLKRELIDQIADKNYQYIFFFEEGVKNGGMGEHLGAQLTNLQAKYFIKAIENGVVPQGPVSSSLHHLGLDKEGICSFVKEKTEGEHNEN